MQATAMTPSTRRPLAAKLSDAPDRVELLIGILMIALVLLGLITDVLGAAWLFVAPAVAAMAHALYALLKSTDAAPSPAAVAGETEDIGESVVAGPADVGVDVPRPLAAVLMVRAEKEPFGVETPTKSGFDSLERSILRDVAIRTDDDPALLAKDLDLSPETVRDALARVRQRLGAAEDSSLVPHAARLQKSGYLGRGD